MKLSLTLPLILLLAACEPVPYQPNMQECKNVKTNEVVVFDAKQGRAVGFINKAYTFTDQDGYERVVTISEIGDWKCKCKNL